MWGLEKLVLETERPRLRGRFSAVLTTLTDGWGTPRKGADECTPRTVLASTRAYRVCLSWHPDLAATRRAMLCRVPLAARVGGSDFRHSDSAPGKPDLGQRLAATRRDPGVFTQCSRSRYGC